MPKVYRNIQADVRRSKQLHADLARMDTEERDKVILTIARHPRASRHARDYNALFLTGPNAQAYREELLRLVDPVLEVSEFIKTRLSQSSYFKDFGGDIAVAVNRINP